MKLRVATSPAWVAAVLADFDAFLLDHAACERKASASAMAFVSHYPDRPELVAECIALAREELEHFQMVAEWISRRGLVLAPDRKDPYMQELARVFRRGSAEYFLDRLLTAGVAEARGCERFALVAAGLPEAAEAAERELKEFYRELARAEVRHQDLYIGLARRYFDPAEADARLEEILENEARVLTSLPVRAALY
jgi:tRNA 2-(methylsulfanyl)-N6-isopentenyladenosine37 hydroxylase